MSSLFLLGRMGSPYTSIDYESKMAKKILIFYSKMAMKWPWGIPSSHGRVAGRVFEFPIFEPKFHDLHDLFF